MNKQSYPRNKGISSHRETNPRRSGLNTGFTLLEILLVVAAIGILAGIVILAINPSKQLGDTRNAERKVDVNTILNAVYQYSIDNNGALPSSITVSSTEICATGVATSTCTTDNLVDLSVLTRNEKYLTAIPTEPQKTNVDGAGYQIKKSVNGRITVNAQFAEQSSTISVTR
ncbi:MAG TPA: prepilin-type N-terminal cleavage/methylation domain-containing protein [Candidatus Paceibacterota bacterium]|nr:prepilin-type N-terminal cleavage/methylation domain-containing protein [Candidatus Paceibacterota bacterium]